MKKQTLLVILVLFTGAVHPAGSLAIVAKGKDEKPLAQAVVILNPTGKSKVPAAPNATFVLNQKGQAFVPEMSVVRKPTLLKITNNDTVQHHVYSFSHAKKFDFPLKGKGPMGDVMLNETGPVVIGCNIHDWMVGYIYVTESPFYAVIENGKAKIGNLPMGTYQLEVWHPNAKPKDLKALAKEVKIESDVEQNFEFVLATKATKK